AKIGSFLSSLELLLVQHRYEHFMALSTMMKEEFLKTITDRFYVIGASTNQKLSNMVALKPREDYQWVAQSEQDLAVELSKKGINCAIIDKADDALWIRLTFLYFITFADIKRLKLKLFSLVRAS